MKTSRSGCLQWQPQAALDIPKRANVLRAFVLSGDGQMVHPPSLISGAMVPSSMAPFSPAYARCWEMAPVLFLTLRRYVVDGITQDSLKMYSQPGACKR